VYAGHIRVRVRPSFSIVKDNKLTGVQLGYYLGQSASPAGGLFISPPPPSASIPRCNARAFFVR
jgi:hypothetical protein